jgi:hypothetical protein
MSRGKLGILGLLFKKNLYDEAMQAVADIEAYSHARVVTADQLKLALGELLDI